MQDEQSIHDAQVISDLLDKPRLEGRDLHEV